MGVGVALGSALDDMGVGIGLGIGVGVAFAVAFGAVTRRSDARRGVSDAAQDALGGPGATEPEPRATDAEDGTPGEEDGTSGGGVPER